METFDLPTSLRVKNCLLLSTISDGILSIVCTLTGNDYKAYIESSLVVGNSKSFYGKITLMGHWL